MNYIAKLAGWIIPILPAIFAGDLLMIGTMVTGMGMYFESTNTIAFGIYDIILGFYFVNNTIKQKDK